jgi:hypothetical protein
MNLSSINIELTDIDEGRTASINIPGLRESHAKGICGYKQSDPIAI